MLLRIPMSDPFDLKDPDAYRFWRDNALKGYPAARQDRRAVTSPTATAR